MDVSIIIPTYNRLWCLPKAIESCRNTQCKTEIIIVDDGSTDGTWEWLKTQTDIVTIKQPNQGQTWAVNRGTAIAEGRYIRFLDSDDILCAGIIDKQFQAALNNDATLVYSRVDSMEFKSGKITKCPEPPLWDDFLAVQLGETYGSHFLGMLFHRDLVKKVPRRPNFAYREDRMFLLEVGLLNPKLALVPGCVGYWVQHEQQMQANYRGLKTVSTNWQHLNIYKRILGELAYRNELTIRRRKAACKVLWSLAHWIAYTHPPEAAEVAEWIYQLDPDFQPPEAGLLGQLYQHLGFLPTEHLLSFRRSVLKLLGHYPSIPKLHHFPI
ncbi:MAG: glycosyltransferase [Cyanobacteria bacterium J06621_15]